MSKMYTFNSELLSSKKFCVKKNNSTIKRKKFDKLTANFTKVFHPRLL